ncbi:MAG: hypothetical protein IKL02_05945 [Kiritimatiellae bacterium]|nr:hypothetical protein [Kiritimatiellia bacterium]
MAYSGTDFTRKYKLDGVSDSVLSSVKANVLDYNANLPEADKQIFISDDYDNSDPEEIIGSLASITAAQYETVEYTRINLN